MANLKHFVDFSQPSTPSLPHFFSPLLSYTECVGNVAPLVPSFGLKKGVFSVYFLQQKEISYFHIFSAKANEYLLLSVPNSFSGTANLAGASRRKIGKVNDDGCNLELLTF